MVTKDTLSKEIETYNKNKSSLLKTDSGKFVLIKGDKIIGLYDTKNDAIKIGIDKFDNTPFLVKKITEIEEPINFTSNMIRAIKCLQ
jgi:hypothetical protein